MKELLVCVDGGKGIGLGHASRGFGLVAAAGAVYDSVTIVVPDGSGLRNYFQESGHEVIEIEWGFEHLLGLVARLSVPVMSMDSYRIAPDKLGIFEDEGIRIISFDDGLHQTYPVSILVNGSPSAKRFNYKVKGGVALLGLAYQIVRPQFSIPSDREFREACQNILVTIGGDDSTGIAPRLFDLLSDFCHRYHQNARLHYVIGPYMQILDRPWRDNEIPHISPNDMRALMLQADIAVSAGGQTLYELARCACPTIGLCTGDDQVANLEALAETGSLIYAGRGDVDATFDVVLDTLNALMNDQERRRDLGRTASRLVDGLGGQRVVGYAAHLDKRPI